jgi:regulator of sirC expression with transglutaminase-like and TPR domain
MGDLTFTEEIQSEPINIPRAALRFAKEIGYPELNVAAELEHLDKLAESARANILPYQTTIEQAESLGDFLFVQERFQGNVHDYADPRNSYLNEVLQRRLGIPISLSVIYMALAERLGIPAQGIGLPGHFIVGIPQSEDMYFIDPFHGGNRLALEDCVQLVQQSTGYHGPLQRDWLQPIPPRAILTRMLNNLRNIYFQGEAWDLALSVVERLRALQPNMPDLLRDLGLIYQRQGAFRMSIQFYEGYLTKAPTAPDARAVRSQLEEVVKSLAKLN